MDQLKILEFRKRAVAWLEYACAGNPGLNSLRHLEIKEGRQVKIYSSCADLAHWMWFRLGMRMPWINRREHLGWVQGVNVSRIVTHSEPYRGQLLEGGDVIVIANDWPKGSDAHVICIVDQPAANYLLTAESGLPGNGLQRRNLPMKRRIQTVLSLKTVLERAEATGQIDLTVPPEPPTLQTSTAP